MITTPVTCGGRGCDLFSLIVVGVFYLLSVYFAPDYLCHADNYTEADASCHGNFGYEKTTRVQCLGVGA